MENRQPQKFNNIHIFTKTRRSDSSTSAFKFVELPKLKPFDESNYCTHLYTEKVSVGLVETKTIVILGEGDNKSVKPISALPEYYSTAISEGWKFFLYIDTLEQENLRFFTVDSSTNEIKWTDRLLLDPNADILSAQIGFIGDKEGQYENNIYICEIKTDETDPTKLTGLETLFHVGTIRVFSSAVGEDERYRTFFENFGIPDPISYMDVFMDSEDHEDKPNYGKYDGKMDWDLLNKRSKQIFLAYHEIFPYVGTYKALVNAVDILGYNDIYFKEWYKELTEDASEIRYTTYEIPYKNQSNTKNIITTIPLEKRILLKKMNWLTMVYKISEEAVNEYGEQAFEDVPVDAGIPRVNVMMPLIQVNYKNYEANEILVKLITLKKWLEKNIIGINCRIIDINGEGIVFERYVYKSFAKTTSGLDYYDEHYLSPYITDKSKLLLQDCSASISIGLKEQQQDDFEKYFYADGDTTKPIYDHFVVKAAVSSRNAALSSTPHAQNGTGITTKTLLIQDGEIFFDPKILTKSNDYYGIESDFLILPVIQIEKARLRDPNLPWKTSTVYYITNEKYSDEKTNTEYKYKVINIPNGTLTRKEDYIALKPAEGASLKYTVNNKLGVPLFIIKNFKDYIIPGAIDQNRDYILEILDGKFIFDEEIDGVNRTTYLNMHFDTKENEQTIEVNYVYTKTVPFDASLLPTRDKDGNITSYPEELTTLTVNNIGDYNVFIYGMDNYGLIHGKRTDEIPNVRIPSPDMEIYTANKNSNNESDFYNTNTDGEIVSYTKQIPSISSDNMYSFRDAYKENTTCTMKEQYLMNDVTIGKKTNGETIIRYATYPTISYSVDTPKENDYAHFMNITDVFRFVDYVSSDSLESYYITPSVTNTYDYVERTKYALVWLKRNDAFKANTLNDGINMNDSGIIESFSPSKQTNIVIYDNIHSEAVYQEMCYLNFDIYQKTNERLNYIILPEDTLNQLVIYYKEHEIPFVTSEEVEDNLIKTKAEKMTDLGDDLVQFGNYDEDADHSVVYMSQAVGLEGGGINVRDMFRDGRMYKIYAQAAYDIPVAEIISPKSDDEDKSTTIIFKSEYCPNLNVLFPVGKKVKLTYKVRLNADNELVSQNFFTCVETGKNYIKVDANFKYIYDEKTSMFTFEFRDTHDPADWEYESSLLQGYNTLIIDGSTYYQPYDSSVRDSDELLYTTDSKFLDKNLFISYAHNAFVDYVLTVDYAKELINGYTELYVKDDNLLRYVDNTFSISNRNFDIGNAFYMWMGTSKSSNDAAICDAFGDGYDSYYVVYDDVKYNYSEFIKRGEGKKYVWKFTAQHGMAIYCESDTEEKEGPTEIIIDHPFYEGYNEQSQELEDEIEKKLTINQDIFIYRYTDPVTIESEGNHSHIIFVPITNGMISTKAFVSNYGNGVHCRWRLYRYDTKKDVNELMFECWNNFMFISPKTEGMYSVELTLFDEYGNTSSIMSEGIFKVKK